MIFQQLLEAIISQKLDIDSLASRKDEFMSYTQKVLTTNSIDVKELRAVIQLCLDYYTYSDRGDTLIPDHQYDLLVNRYYAELNGRTKEITIIYPDAILDGNRWNFISHEIPGMVGTISDKLYSYQELKETYEFWNTTEYTISPKLDGVSVSIKRKDGKIIYGATRYDGLHGQDITALIHRAQFPKWWDSAPDGFYKCEIVVSTKDFNALIEHKQYANRRSATSGIINTPKNLQYGNFLTVVPLLYYNQAAQIRKSLAPGSKTVKVFSAADLMDEIDAMLEKIRSNDFPFRVDGVVCLPVGISRPINEGDLMEPAFAYKVNTNEGKTTIEYGYMSVGRLGSVCPMLHVKPVEVNETIVTDVSLGSYAKFASMNLHEHEEVIIYSAGDVIPQVKLPLMRTNWNNDDDLRMDKHCPHCGHKFTKVGTEYFCMNQKCPRVRSGKVANFIIKLGVQGYSDKTVEALCNAGLIQEIPDLFSLDVDDICAIEGFNRTSAKGFISQLQALREKPIPISIFFGALGISGISMKKCQKIFSQVSLKKLMKNPGKNSVYDAIRSAEGIGNKTASIFVHFVDDNYDLIAKLLGILNIVGDSSNNGVIVFTGFRNSRWAEQFASIGYDVGDSVTRDTTALIYASDDHKSTKYFNALKKGVPVFPYSDIETVFKRLRRGEPLKEEPEEPRDIW